MRRFFTNKTEPATLPACLLISDPGMLVHVPRYLRVIFASRTSMRFELTILGSKGETQMVPIGDLVWINRACFDLVMGTQRVSAVIVQEADEMPE